MNALRDLVAAILVGVATILTAVWLPSAWVRDHVVNQEGFMMIAGPLGEDPELQRQLTDPAVEQVLNSQGVPQWVQVRIRPTLKEALVGITGTDAYNTMWNAALREVHGALFEPGASPVEVDLQPAVDTLVDAAQEAVPWVEIPRPTDTTITVATIPDVPLLPRIAQLTSWVRWLLPLAVISAVSALAIARHRRGMLTALGIALALAAAVLTLLVANIEALVPDALDQMLFVGPVVQVFEREFQQQITPAALIMLGTGAMIGAVGIVLIVLTYYAEDLRTIYATRATRRRGEQAY